MASRRVGQISVRTASLFLCDMQEKFRPNIQYFPQIVEVARRMFRAAENLDIPVIATEQYPKGLGPTIPEIGLDRSKYEVHAKTCFTMVSPVVEQQLKYQGTKSVILCGIETQACIQQTTLDLLERDFDVHVIADGCSSRSMVDRMFAIERMRQSGAFITTSEAMLLQLLQDSKNPKFKDVQKLIMTSAPDSGLLSKIPEN
ncbi:isochorismatase domain-containing protein 2-like [Anneissia japonica]|uniref:isochorismatase domain-containing protein 2-like n=1 Tax=Anneissia japonica TaxID=1529436 RepID=UPI0014258B3D|nr:isochorismatase domain-containing protein 2-like [Anneissia japonica]